MPARYRIEPPPLPAAWAELLGEPRWRLEWTDPSGRYASWEGAGGDFPDLEIPVGWASPVLAWPYWPRLEIPPGYLRPAGALYPFDAAGGRIALSWRGGVEAIFFRELAAAGVKSAEAAPRAAGRRPEFFDWPRFRELLAGETVPREIRRDPWLADWGLIAANTVRSGFDRRRIVPGARDTLRVTIPCPGPWIGASPFWEAPYWEAGEEVDLGGGDTVDTYISAGGLLRCTRGSWAWFPR